MAERFEREPQQSAQPEQSPELPQIDEKLQKRLEAQFSEPFRKSLEEHSKDKEKSGDPFDDLTSDELWEESFRLLRNAHSKETEDAWQSLWWFFRLAEESLHKRGGAQVMPGEAEHLLSVYKHVPEDSPAHDDIEKWYNSHHHPNMPDDISDTNWSNVA